MNHQCKRKKKNNKEHHIENKVNKLKKQVVQIIWIKIIEVQEGKVVVKLKNQIMKKIKKN